jgi:formate/nitrite transporter
MEPKQFLAPQEITHATIQNAIKKVSYSRLQQFILGILAGAFIAFASEGSNMAAFNLLGQPETYGLGKATAGAIFGTGLMMVIIAGAELFTGNTMIIAAVLDRKVRITTMLSNWLFVYLGNFFGSVLIAYLMIQSGLFNSGESMLGAMTIKIGVYKVGLTFTQAFVLGILCNWLVCIAVWMSTGAKDITGKLLAIFFPIWLFITSGFEHSVANMYYIPAAIMAKGNSSWARAAMEHGVTSDQLMNLNWSTFFLKNLIPVTLGNIVGGAFFVAGIYWFVYRTKKDVMKH